MKNTVDFHLDRRYNKIKKGVLNYAYNKKGDLTIKVIMPDEVDEYLTEEDIDMDKRVNAGVKAAIERLKECKKPIARYDPVKKKAYMEYPDGTRDYSE